MNKILSVLNISLCFNEMLSKYGVLKSSFRIENNIKTKSK